MDLLPAGVAFRTPDHRAPARDRRASRDHREQDPERKLYLLHEDRVALATTAGVPLCDPFTRLSTARAGGIAWDSKTNRVFVTDVDRGAVIAIDGGTGAILDDEHVTGLTAPTAICTDGRGSLFVGETGTRFTSGRVGRYSVSDRSMAQPPFMTNLAHPWSLACDRGSLFVGTYHAILECTQLSSTPTVIERFRYMSSKRGLAVMPNGDLLVCLTDVGSVVRLDRDGSRPDTISTERGPTSIAVSADGRVYMSAFSSNGRRRILSARGVRSADHLSFVLATDAQQFTLGPVVEPAGPESRSAEILGN